MHDEDLTPAPPPGALLAARQLLAGCRVASLATVAGDQPHAALVSPAPTPAGVLLLLSELSQHTRDLRRNPACALLCLGPAAADNPQTTQRLSLSGTARVQDDAALLQAYLAVHPYAAGYAGFADFHLWRLEVNAVQFIAGFGQAWRFPANGADGSAALWRP